MARAGAFREGRKKAAEQQVKAAEAPPQPLTLTPTLTPTLTLTLTQVPNPEPKPETLLPSPRAERAP